MAREHDHGLLRGLAGRVFLVVTGWEVLIIGCVICVCSNVFEPVLHLFLSCWVAQFFGCCWVWATRAGSCFRFLNVDVCLCSGGKE